MNLKCLFGHQLYEANRFYHKPSLYFHVDGGDDLRRSLLANGFTTIEIKCRHCPYGRLTEHYGDLTRENAIDSALARMERIS